MKWSVVSTNRRQMEKKNNHHFTTPDTLLASPKEGITSCIVSGEITQALLGNSLHVCMELVWGHRKFPFLVLCIGALCNNYASSTLQKYYFIL